MTLGEELAPERSTCPSGSPEGEAVGQECALRTVLAAGSCPPVLDGVRGMDHMGAFDRGLGWGPMRRAEQHGFRRWRLYGSLHTEVPKEPRGTDILVEMPGCTLVVDFPVFS